MPILAALLLASTTANACEPSIVGRWQSDGPATMAYMREHARLDAPQDAFLASLMGRMVVDFDQDSGRVRFPAVEVPLRSGGSHSSEAFEERFVYRMLFCDARVTVIHSTDATGKDSVSTYHFIGPDRMWVYGGKEDPAVPDLHVREYFRRVPPDGMDTTVP